MEIVICGAGKVGEVLCRDLSREEHNVVVIDSNEKRLNQVLHMADISGFLGSGSLYELQLEAGVDHCDIFIAVTPDDETNIIAAITARKIGAKYVVARVRSPEYSLQMDFLRESLGITLMINPELEAAREIERMMAFPAALDVEDFGQGRVFIVKTELPADSPHDGQTLKNIRARFNHLLAAIVERGEAVYIPGGDFVLQAGDKLYLTGAPDEIRRFCCGGRTPDKKLQSLLIVGGGRVTRYLLPRLAKLQMRSKVIENKESVAERLAAEFPGVEVICADGTDQAILLEERMQNYDAVIALTGIDEENLLLALYAARQGVGKTITKVNRTNLLKVLENAGLQAIVTPHRLIADQIIRFVRSMQNSEGSNIEAFYRLSEGRAEVLQFKIAAGSPVCGVSLQDLRTQSEVLIICIMRGKEIIFPAGGDALQAADDVIVVTTRPNFQDISDILRKG